jgi:hypothetical protein
MSEMLYEINFSKSFDIIYENNFYYVENSSSKNQNNRI